MMIRKLGMAILAMVTLSTLSLPSQSSAGFNAPGWSINNLGITGAEMAVSQSGLFALAQDSYAGGGTIVIYDKVGSGRTEVARIAAPSGQTFGTFGGLTWADDNTLAFTENSDTNAAWSYSLNTSTLNALTSMNALASPAQIAYAGNGSYYVVDASAPGAGGVSLVNNGNVTAIATGLGTGYLGGIALDNLGNIFVGDTNDPNFAGNAGNILKLSNTGSLVDTISLLNGEGSGCSSILWLSDGSLLATTGSTVSRYANGSVTRWGLFDASYDYGYGLTDARDGSILINGTYTSAGSIVQASPVPEPASLVLLAMGMTGLIARKRKSRI